MLFNCCSIIAEKQLRGGEGKPGPLAGLSQIEKVKVAQKMLITCPKYKHLFCY